MKDVDKLRDLPEGAHVVTYTEPFELSDTLNIIADNIMEVGYETEQITGAALDMEDGEVRSIWVTDRSRPFMADTPYDRIL